MKIVLAGLAIGSFSACSPTNHNDATASTEEITNKAAPPVATRIDNFRLHDHTGRSHEWRRDGARKPIILFTAGNGCPIVRRQLDTLRDLRERFDDRVNFFFLNANPQDLRADIVREADQFSIDFPILMDRAQIVARSLGIRRTGEAILIDPATGNVAYRGPIDDRLDYGVARKEATASWLADAIEALLSGDEILPATTDLRGCLILIKPWPEEVSYVHDVAPILQRRCLECHQPNHIAPFAFNGFDMARGWSPMIAEVIRTERMPPWHAVGEADIFANDRSLTNEEKRILLRWVELGAPRGDGADPLASLKLDPPEEWPLGQPDLIVAIPEEVHLPARGVFDYRYFEVEAKLDEDVWIRAADVRPTNLQAVHHVLVFVRYPEHYAERQPEFQDGLQGFFASYVPGTDSWAFPEDTGKFLPAGSTFVFQLHYVSTGKPEVDHSRMGLYFYTEPPPTELHTRSAYNTRLRIPPEAADHEVTASHVVDDDVLLWGMSPHMHFRGSRFEIEARYPDGQREILLTVPNYDFNWQTMYHLNTPKMLPKGTEILCRGGFDNSSANPANPDPSQEVSFGEQTTDEMFIGYLLYSNL